MNKIVKLAVFGFVGLALFGGAFFGFTQMLGVQPHQLPLIGGAFPEPPPEQEIEGDEADAATEADGIGEAPSVPSVTAPADAAPTLSVLDTFTLSVPYSSAELKQLVDALKSKQSQLETWELAKRLTTYTPDEAARILQGLEVDRAKELLDALPSEVEWKAYAEAYAQAPEKGGGT